jgi:hypothetical protein
MFTTEDYYELARRGELHQLDRQPNDPTPTEILLRCAIVRSRWTEEERLSRLSGIEIYNRRKQFSA